MDEASHTPSFSEPKSRLYKEDLSIWAKSIIDMALDAGMKVMDYDGVLQPQIYLFSLRETWHKPPFMEMAGKELFIKIPHNDYGHILHLRLQSFYWRYTNPNDDKDHITLLFYAPMPPVEETDSKPMVKVKGVVNGHVVDVWVEEGVQQQSTPRAAKRMTFELTGRDMLHIKELSLAGVIDGKIAKGEYEEEDV